MEGLVRRLRRSCMPFLQHPRAHLICKSYPAFLKERQRHTYSNSGVIHPLSIFSLVWTYLMVIFRSSRMVIAPLRLCFVVDSISSPSLHPMDWILLGIQILCTVDMLVQFNTGLLDGDNEVVVLDRREIILAYLRDGFFLDMVGTCPIAFFVVQRPFGDGYIQFLAHSLPVLNILRITHWFGLLSIVLESMLKSDLVRRLLKHLILFVLVIHWCTCVQYLMTMARYYFTGVEHTDYNELLLLGEAKLSQTTILHRYWKAYFISMATFLGTGFSLFKVDRPEEIVVTAFIILGASIFMIYTIVLLLHLYMNECNSSTRYYEMMNEVENYMQSKQFPPELRERILQFYDYKYQRHYFREEYVLDGLSDHLRQEIELQQRKKLLKTVDLFTGLPKSLVTTLLACLLHELYLPGDLIVRASEVGDSMFFLACGSVAVYTPKGVEMCHLEDGAYFGEVSLVMNNARRVITAVAIDNCEVYRLDRSDFRRYLMTNESLYEKLKSVALARVNESERLDEAYLRKKNANPTPQSHPHGEPQNPPVSHRG